MLERVDHVHVFVSDRLRAETWYRDVLDLRREPWLEVWATAKGPLKLTNSSGSIRLALFEAPPQPSRSTIALRVDGARFLSWLARIESALERRLDVVDHDLAWSIYFDDPFANPYEITCCDHAAIAATVEGLKSSASPVRTTH